MTKVKKIDLEEIPLPSEENTVGEDVKLSGKRGRKPGVSHKVASESEYQFFTNIMVYLVFTLLVYLYKDENLALTDNEQNLLVGSLSSLLRRKLGGTVLNKAVSLIGAKEYAGLLEFSITYYTRIKESKKNETLSEQGSQPARGGSPAGINPVQTASFGTPPTVS